MIDRLMNTATKCSSCGKQEENKRIKKRIKKHPNTQKEEFKKKK